jgi:hypothetical protein
MRGFEPKETWHHGTRQFARSQVTGDIPAPQTGPFASSRHGDNYAATAGATHPPIGSWLNTADTFSTSRNFGPQSGINSHTHPKFHPQTGFQAGAFAPGSMSGGQTSPYMGGYGPGGYGMGGYGGGYGGMMNGISPMNGGVMGGVMAGSVMTGHYGNSHGMMFNVFPTGMGMGMMM